MKKRVALLLAAVMTISLLPVNAFAATNNYVDNRVTVPDATAVMENGVSAKVGFGSYLNAAGSNWSGDPSYYVDGTDLVVPLQRDVVDGYQFKLTLSNAIWYFRQNAPDNNGVFNSTIAAVNSEFGTNYAFQQAIKNFPTVSDTTPMALYTYDPGKGYFNPINSDNAGTYYRLDSTSSTTISGTVYAEIPYKLDVSSLNNNVATITIYKSVQNASATQGYCLRIPLVTYISDSNVEATVTIDPGNSSTVTAQKIIFANTANGKTNTSAKSVKVSRDVWDLDSVIINELRVGTITSGQIIKLTLPAGYHFADPNSTNSSGNIASVGLEPGLAWGSSGQSGYGARGSIVPSGYNTNGVATGYTLTGDYALVYGSNTNANDKLNQYYYNNYTNNGSDDSTLFIYLNNVRSSDQIRGSIYVDNLQIWADDDAVMPTAGNSIDINMHIVGYDGGNGNNITEQDFLVAQRVDWLIGLKTVTDVPTLVSGRYIGPSWSGVDADDNTHLAATVQLYETSVNAWWGARTTVLVLPATDNSSVKGAKFRKVTVDDMDKVNSPIKDSAYGSNLYNLSPSQVGNGTYLNDNERHSVITVNDNKITISNISLDSTDPSWINFKLWVSIEYGYGKQSGDLTLSVDPSSTSLTGAAADNLPSVVIAHVVDPITVSTNVSDLKIGYQYQTTSDIQIKENGAGYLLRGKTVKVSITDMISSDMYFTNDTKIAVTSGDLKITNIVATGEGGFTSQSSSWLGDNQSSGSLSFDIDRASTVASTVTISNVAVKLDRTVPVTNKSAYQVVVWGTAVAENYGLVDDQGRTWKADFNTPGEFLPYINVISAPQDQASILTQEVRVTIGESYYVVNGQTYSMDAVPYISTASNSTMVPLRFVANAFGIRDDQILWDDANKTATINAPNKVLQFKIGSNSMIVNGVSVPMLSPDGLPVSAEIKTINGLGRTYLPFRALGNAFGVPVDWEADTQTAIYNKGANTNGTAAVSNTTPVQQ